MDGILIPVILLAVIGLVAGIMLALAAKFMPTPTNEQLEAVKEALPGVNCGACGFAGCNEYAEKVAQGVAKTNLCVPGGAAVSHSLSQIMGTAYEETEEKYGVVRCSGSCDKVELLMEYQGKLSCAACDTFFQGRKTCSWACLGYGDCVSVCEYDAIHIVDNVASIDPQKCSGCGLCAKKCPDRIIQMVPRRNLVHVDCHSNDKGVSTRKICSAGCIGCRKCEKTCPHDAIHVVDNLARVDYEKCTNCMACISVCPTGVIHTCLEPASNAKGNTAQSASA